MLSPAETSALKSFARNHKVTVSPLLHAAAVARMSIEHAANWPLKKEDLYVDIWPYDIRPALKPKLIHGVLLGINMSPLVLNIGRILSYICPNATRQQALERLPEIIAALTEDARQDYGANKLAQQRASRAKSMDEDFSDILQGILSDEIP